MLIGWFNHIAPGGQVQQTLRLLAVGYTPLHWIECCPNTLEKGQDHCHKDCSSGRTAVKTYMELELWQTSVVRQMTNGFAWPIWHPSQAKLRAVLVHLLTFSVSSEFLRIVQANKAPALTCKRQPVPWHRVLTLPGLLHCRSRAQDSRYRNSCDFIQGKARKKEQPVLS